MVSRVTAAASQGYGGSLVTVECDITNGLPGIHIVGMANKSVDEAKERIKSAITNSGLVVPRKRITLNLSPANLPKEGSAFDLAMAVAILVGSKQIPPSATNNMAFIGELSLDGEIKSVPGIIGHIEAGSRSGLSTFMINADNARQASLINSTDVLAPDSLNSAYKHMVGSHKLAPVRKETKTERGTSENTLSLVVGQELAKKALVVAASGGHNILLTGPPGTGKTMLAKAFSSLLPGMSSQELIEVTHLHSLLKPNIDIVNKRPFRAPHHSSSHVALVGGGRSPLPGEITLAHRGVLFLDEFPEFNRQTIEALRQPLEDRTVTVSRSNSTVTYPANFILVATQNPCPCGWLGSKAKDCVCTPQQIATYTKKLSGPILDRIDMVIPVHPVDNSRLLQTSTTAPTEQYYNQVKLARESQRLRFSSRVKLNAHMNNGELKLYARLDTQSKELLNRAEKQLKLSPRSYLKVIKVARTIADIQGSKDIKQHHIAESLQYRFR